MNKSTNIDIKSLVAKVKKMLPALVKHTSFIAVLLILIVYLFSVWRISQLAEAEPLPDQQTTVLTQIPKIDEKAIQQIQALEQSNTEVKSLFNFFLLGLVQGLLLNLHISFGVGIMVSWFFYFVVIFFFIFVSKKKALMSNLANWFINCFAFGIGFISILLPFFLFELRHGFMQINSLFFTLNQGFIHNKAVVGQIGLTKIQILNTFFNRYTDLLSINNKLSIIIVFLIIGLVLMYIKKGKIKSSESKIIVFLFFNTFVILFTYLTAKNPVWSYHFIAVEIMFIFLTGILIKKYSLVKYILTLWVLILLVINIYRFGLSFNHKQNYPELMEKRATVERIYQDAGGEKFDSNASIIYLIIPKDLISDKVGFTENRTPEMKYKTMTEWTSQNGTLIIKRRLKK